MFGLETCQLGGRKRVAFLLPYVRIIEKKLKKTLLLCKKWNERMLELNLLHSLFQIQSAITPLCSHRTKRKYRWEDYPSSKWGNVSCFLWLWVVFILLHRDLRLNRSKGNWLACFIAHRTHSILDIYSILLTKHLCTFFLSILIVWQVMHRSKKTDSLMLNKKMPRVWKTLFVNRICSKILEYK